jgi:hypothetical protein
MVWLTRIDYYYYGVHEQMVVLQGMLHCYSFAAMAQA